MAWYMLDDYKNVIPAPVDDKGMPTAEYHEWLYGSDGKNKVIKQQDVNGFWVSTVFLGLDHGFMNDAPLVFETMIFNRDMESQNCWRYRTYNEALDGHAAACKEAGMQGSGIERDDLEKAAKVIQDLLDRS